jgi:type VI secretion system protein ImpA
MASPDVLDFERLLAPISDDAPAGFALREDFSPSSVYYKIKGARNTARDAERKGLYPDEKDETTKVAPPDWSPVVSLGQQILAEKSKDLEIAAWLTEALVRRSNYPGLRDGFRLIRELVERYWDSIHPRPDEDGILTTIAPITGLNGDQSEGALVKPIADVPITEPGAFRAFSCGDYLQAVELEKVTDLDKRQQRIDQGAVSLSMLEQAIRETPRDFLLTMREDLHAAYDEFERMTALLDERCGRGEDGYSQAPPSSNLRQALLDCKEIVDRLVKPDVAAGAEGEVVSNGDHSLVAVGGEAVGGNRKIQTRDDAFRALLMVADFFQRTEPHSPVSYALRQAVRWGQMPLPELLMELIPDATVRDGLFRHVGIRVDEKSS